MKSVDIKIFTSRTYDIEKSLLNEYFHRQYFRQNYSYTYFIYFYFHCQTIAYEIGSSEISASFIAKVEQRSNDQSNIRRKVFRSTIVCKDHASRMTRFASCKAGIRTNKTQKYSETC